MAKLLKFGDLLFGKRLAMAGREVASVENRAIRGIGVDEPQSHFGTVETWGLAEHGLPEIEVREVRQFLLPYAAALVRRLAGYFVVSARPIRAGETVSFGMGSAVRLEQVASESGRSAPTVA